MKAVILLGLAWLSAGCVPHDAAHPPADKATPPVLCNGATVSCMNEVLSVGIK